MTTTSTNLSLTNSKIRAYFESRSDDAPLTELLYVHTHPLVTPNFLGDVERLVNETAEFMTKKNLSGKPVDRFVALAVRLGKLLPKLDKDNGTEALTILRDIFKLCNQITGKR